MPDTCSRFLQNTPADMYEVPACTDYCRRCGRHFNDHNRTPLFEETARTQRIGSDWDPVDLDGDDNDD